MKYSSITPTSSLRPNSIKPQKYQRQERKIFQHNQFDSKIQYRPKPYQKYQKDQKSNIPSSKPPSSYDYPQQTQTRAVSTKYKRNLEISQSALSTNPSYMPNSYNDLPLSKKYSKLAVPQENLNSKYESSTTKYESFIKNEGKYRGQDDKMQIGKELGLVGKDLNIPMNGSIINNGNKSGLVNRNEKSYSSSCYSGNYQGKGQNGSTKTSNINYEQRFNNNQILKNIDRVQQKIKNILNR